MRVDETAQPTVALALDASANMLEVSDAEQHTAQGLREAVKRPGPVSGEHGARDHHRS